MYGWGDLTEEAYLAERRRVRADLASLEGATDWTTVLAQAAAFLRDLPAAWEAATPDQRNALARTVFQSVEITDGRVAAVVPQPEFAPFFNLAGVERPSAGNDERQPSPAAPDRQASTLAGGSDGIRFSTFRTFSVPEARSASRCPISGRPPFISRVGPPHRGMTALLPAATPVAPAS